MRKLLWIGNGYFSRRTTALGWELTELDPDGKRLYAWEELVELAGGPPDVLVLADKSLPPLLLGLESYPCLTVFYCVDSHIHGWHPTYGQAFDLCLVSLKDHLSRFMAPGSRLTAGELLWSPAFGPPPEDCPRDALPKEWDLLFVGNRDPETMPGRVAFLRELKSRFPALELRRGDYRALFPRARLVLNHAERGDLNFRVFQALACGACLLTPTIGHGQEELFRPGQDLFTFDPTDMDALLALVRELLADPARCAAVGASGRAVIENGHHSDHRAAAFDRFVRAQDAEALVRRRLENAEAIHAAYLKLLYLHFAETSADPRRGVEYLRAAQRLSQTAPPRSRT
jgi:hypothetical protein